MASVVKNKTVNHDRAQKWEHGCISFNMFLVTAVQQTHDFGKGMMK